MLFDEDCKALPFVNSLYFNSFLSMKLRILIVGILVLIPAQTDLLLVHASCRRHP